MLRLRPEEPQSYRDLALALDRRAGAVFRPTTPASLPGLVSAAPGLRTPASIDDYMRALALFSEIVQIATWDARFPEIEVVALIKANRIQSLTLTTTILFIMVLPGR